MSWAFFILDKRNSNIFLNRLHEYTEYAWHNYCSDTLQDENMEESENKK